MAELADMIASPSTLGEVTQICVDEQFELYWSRDQRIDEYCLFFSELSKVA
jgi:hypothetical protein